MQRQEVQSSLIKWVGYDQDKMELAVEFKKGGVYLYSDVPLSVFKSMMASESIGRFFLTQIKAFYLCRKPPMQTVAAAGIDSQEKVGR